MTKVYLAGPMVGIDPGIARGWRESVTLSLKPAIECLSPMRSTVETQHRQKLITIRDKLDIIRADLILVNFIGATTISAGTFIEIGWADMLQKPIVVIIDEENVNHHLMGDLIAIQVATLPIGVRIVKELLNVGNN